MNRNIALALLLACAGAHADDITMDPPFTSSLTRAQVLQELQQYRQSGTNPWADDYNPVIGFGSARTREEVTGEYIRSRDMVGAFTGEDSGSASLARLAARQGAARSNATASAQRRSHLNRTVPARS